MRGERRQITAAFALAAFAAPWLAIAGLAAHLMVDPHHLDRPNVAADIDAALHGHWHAAATPEHEHVLVQAVPSALMPRPQAVVLALAHPLSPAAGAMLVSSPRARRVECLGLGPPSPARLPSVLRS